MLISVIVCTYNQPAFLELVLRGLSAQTDRNFELVVADDGSGPETATLLTRVRSATGLHIVHVWHEDRGFRKTDILNRAIAASRGEYLFFTDGDCIPRRDLIEVHRNLARPRRFVSSGYIRLPGSITSRVSLDDVESGRVAELSWLMRQGWNPGRLALRFTGSRTLGAAFDSLTPTPPNFRGSNASTWREHIFEVNGFEGDMGYGGEDQALGYRLIHAGIRGIQARHRAITMHLEHARPYRTPAIIECNREITRRIQMKKETRARRGLAELAPDASLKVDGRNVYK